MFRPATRLLTVGGVAALAVGIAAAPALAHVSVSAPGATQGGFTVLSFRVPTESETASTVGIKVQLPTDQPLGSVSVRPHAGWTYTTQKAKLSTPIKTDDGEVSEAVSVVDWKASSAATGIKPGEYDEFQLSVGPLPKAPTMTFKVIQSYSDGSQVAWIDEPAPGSTQEPEHPAPVLQLASATGSAGASASQSPGAPSPAAPSVTAAVPATSAGGAGTGSVTGAYILGGLGLLAGLAGLGLGLSARRRPATVVETDQQPAVPAGAE